MFTPEENQNIFDYRDANDDGFLNIDEYMNLIDIANAHGAEPDISHDAIKFVIQEFSSNDLPDA